jgi:uncharacterized hydantoinase/oxoprolinase family protein
VLDEGLVTTGIGRDVLAAVARELGIAAEGFAQKVGEARAARWVDRCAPAYAAARLLALAEEGR